MKFAIGRAECGAVLPHAFPHELIGAQESAPNGLGSATD